MYKYMNVNPLGRVDSDCFIRALSCATHKSWDYVYQKISRLAQIEGAMMNDGRFVLSYLDKRYERLPIKKGSTVEKVSHMYRNDVILITMKRTHNLFSLSETLLIVLTLLIE